MRKAVSFPHGGAAQWLTYAPNGGFAAWDTLVRVARFARYPAVTVHESIVGVGANEGASRRDFLHVATGAYVGMGVLAATWPFIDQMNPGADVLSAAAPRNVVLVSLQPGQEVVASLAPRPDFLVRRPPCY